MADEVVHTIQLSLARGYQFQASFETFPNALPLMLDEPAPLGEANGPNAAAVLAAAVGDCLAASLLFCLRKSRTELQGMQATVTARVRRNEAGRMRIAGIEVELSPGIAAPDLARLKRCEGLFEDFCVVTESVRKGIPVSVKVNEPQDTWEG